MTTLTIPKEYMREKELVLIPRSEYDELVSLRKNNEEEIELSPAGRKALDRMRKNRQLGKMMSIHDLKRKLGY